MLGCLSFEIRLQNLNMLNVSVFIVLIIEFRWHDRVATNLLSGNFSSLFKLFRLLLQKFAGQNGLADGRLTLDRASALSPNR